MTRSIEAGDSGPVVLMLHGTWGHAEAYVRNVVPIAALGYQVYAIDMIGHGFSGRPPGCEYRIDDFVGHVRSYLDALGAESAHIVGESLGGWVAMRAALERSDRIATVINVVGGGLRPVAPTDHEIRGWATLEERSTDILTDPCFDNWQKRMHWLVADPASMPDEMVHVRAAINESAEVRAVSQRVFTSIARMLREEQPGALSAADIAAVSVPVYYLWTDHNPTTPASVAEAAHALTRDSEMDVMTGCGHWPQFELPTVFNRLVGAFLKARA